MDVREYIRYGLVLSGVAMGFVLGVTSTKKHYAQLAQKDINSVKDIYKRRYSQIDVVQEPPSPVEVVFEETVEIEEAVKTLKYDAHDPTRTDYSGKSNLIVDPSRPNIELVDFEEFSDNEYDYQEIVFTYFEVDDILVDDNEEIITDRARHIGDHALKALRAGTGDAVYVINHQNQTQYEIELDMRSYKEIVSGDI